MTIDFSSFLAAYPPDGRRGPLRQPDMASVATAAFHVNIPWELEAFWSQVGAGDFGAQRLRFFGSESGHNLVSWNSLPIWRVAYPVPEQGGPLFFAETCFGDQIGFRVEAEHVRPILFMPDVMESYVIADDIGHLFRTTLIDPDALVDPRRFDAVVEALGPLPPDAHYAPLVSPLIGGSASLENTAVMDAEAHIVSALSEWQALQRHPEGR